MTLAFWAPPAYSIDTCTGNCIINYTTCDGVDYDGDVSCPDKPGYTWECHVSWDAIGNTVTFGGNVCTSVSTGGSGGGGTGGGGTTEPDRTYYYNLYFYDQGNAGLSSPRQWTSTSRDDTFQYTLPSSRPAKSGYTFQGWYCTTGNSQAANPTSYNKDPSDSVEVTYADASCTGVWRKNAEQVRLTYNANNASTPATAVYTRDKGTRFTLADPAKDADLKAFKAPAGKVFVGWNTQPGGWGASLRPGDTITLTADKTLYAQWGDGDCTAVVQTPVAGAPVGDWTWPAAGAAALCATAAMVILRRRRARH